MEQVQTIPTYDGDVTVRRHRGTGEHRSLSKPKRGEMRRSLLPLTATPTRFVSVVRPSRRGTHHGSVLNFEPRGSSVVCDAISVVGSGVGPVHPDPQSC